MASCSPAKNATAKSLKFMIKSCQAGWSLWTQGAKGAPTVPGLRHWGSHRASHLWLGRCLSPGPSAPHRGQQDAMSLPPSVSGMGSSGVRTRLGSGEAEPFLPMPQDCPALWICHRLSNASALACLSKSAWPCSRGKVKGQVGVKGVRAHQHSPEAVPSPSQGWRQAWRLGFAVVSSPSEQN